ncbi:hypothetical protein Theos_0321 [Thermus oshimai JL-2]|uniref:Uncharacterized protein n=1 Tax=Thermus oshimai JL-2 TaxID=751945 RepID=K7RFS0_THEOS|nr:hypothetical protein [Thermus oshimai]AFV75397.1 hypothetical protein Theos_0321 [Thermus oshimai JL-2]
MGIRRLWRVLVLWGRVLGGVRAFWRRLPSGRRAELLAFLLSLLPFRPLRWLGALLGLLAALRR